MSETRYTLLRDEIIDLLSVLDETNMPQQQIIERLDAALKFAKEEELPVPTVDDMLARYAALTSERDAAKAAASTWKRLAKRYRGACAFLGGMVNERDAWIAGMSRDFNAVEVDDASR